MTSATESAGRDVDPLKITSVISEPRIEVGRCSPSTQRTESTTLLFPHPFGPTTPVRVWSPNSNTVRSAKDLKPKSSSRFSRMGWDQVSAWTGGTGEASGEGAKRSAPGSTRARKSGGSA